MGQTAAQKAAADAKVAEKAAADAAAAPASDAGATVNANVPTARASEVRQVQYADGEGWGIGQGAPEDRYIEIGPDGADVGKPVKTPPKGKYARQVAIKGAPITADARRVMGLDK